uniref:PPC domain-containing protein n=1 Tax=Hucho hucho TaxID=62062 RepID=A0A4W5MML9_9TELE
MEGKGRLATHRLILARHSDLLSQSQFPSPANHGDRGLVGCLQYIPRVRLIEEELLIQFEVIHLDERFEIVSLVGTLNKEAHLHFCLANKEGKTVGRHVLGDLEVFTTAELVIGEASDLLFDRQLDHFTGFPELVIQPRSEKN